METYSKKNVIVMNFKYLVRKTTNNRGIEAFYKLIEADHARLGNIVPLCSMGTLGRLNDLKEEKFQTKTLENVVAWYHYFLERKDVTIDDLKERDLSRSGSVTWDNFRLSGDYLGVYLEPTGAGGIKGLFLRLEETEEGYLRAYAIHNLSSTDFLEDKAIFNEDIDYIFDKISRRGSRLLEGMVDGNGNIVIIDVTDTHSRHKIMLVLDVSQYVRFLQETIAEKRSYVGGLGLQIVTNDLRVASPYVTRIGLIRIDKAKGISLRDEKLKDYLTITPHITQWGPLRLSLDWDSLWYEWFMSRSTEKSDGTMNK